MEKLNDESIKNIIQTNHDMAFLNYKNCYCFSSIINNYYFNNWDKTSIDDLKDTTILLLFRLILLSCTKGKLFNTIKNPLEKVRCKSNIIISINKINKLNGNTDRLLKLYIEASKGILPQNIIDEMKTKIMELKLMKE